MNGSDVTGLRGGTTKAADAMQSLLASRGPIVVEVIRRQFIGAQTTTAPRVTSSPSSASGTTTLANDNCQTQSYVDESTKVENGHSHPDLHRVRSVQSGSIPAVNGYGYDNDDDDDDDYNNNDDDNADKHR